MYLRLALARNTYNSRPCDYAMSRPVRVLGHRAQRRSRMALFSATASLSLTAASRWHARQRDKEKRRRGAHPTELFQLMLGFLLGAALELMKAPTNSLEDPDLLPVLPAQLPWPCL
jgi:hypothetical protein